MTAPRPKRALLEELQGQRHATLASLSSALRWTPGRTLAALQDLGHPLAADATAQDRAQAADYARRRDAATRGHQHKEVRLAAQMLGRINSADDALNTLYSSVAGGRVNGAARAFLEASHLTLRQSRRFRAILRLVDRPQGGRRPGRVLLARYAGVCLKTGRRFPPGTLLRTGERGYVALRTRGVRVRRKGRAR
ncbi:hypothetical protein [Deinococcus petrolearius]|uniref:Uncharacterized protein n=1 Tax=Deinococcus petrolearius TaxID=1751295 RepID=A0ABW1DMB0_9DEIO